MLVKAYLDESNSNLQGKVCVVAGHIGYEHQWDGLMKDWQAVLGKRRLHMKGLSWRESDRKLLAKLGPLPDANHLSRVAGVVRNEDYFKYVKGKVRNYTTNPYMICVQLCIEHVLRITANKPEPIEFYFEEQGVYKWRLKDINDTVTRLNKDKRSVSVSTLHKGASRAFEVADYLCYSIAQSRENPHSLRARWSKLIQGNGNCIGQEASSKFIELFAKQCLELGMGRGPVIRSESVTKT